MAAIMKAMGSSGWWFPPLAYRDLIPDMMKNIPTFFDMKYDFRWYFALIPAFTLGPVALPHLAMKVFTASSVKSARWAVVWFSLFLGLLFSGTYAVGFAGNFFTATTGKVIAKADQTLLILNVFYNPTLVAAFVMGGAVAAGLSTIGGNLMAIAGLVGLDLLGIIAPDMASSKKMRWDMLPLPWEVLWPSSWHLVLRNFWLQVFCGHSVFWPPLQRRPFFWVSGGRKPTNWHLSFPLCSAGSFIS